MYVCKWERETVVQWVSDFLNDFQWSSQVRMILAFYDSNVGFCVDSHTLTLRATHLDVIIQSTTDVIIKSDKVIVCSFGYHFSFCLQRGDDRANSSRSDACLGRGRRRQQSWTSIQQSWRLASPQGKCLTESSQMMRRPIKIWGKQDIHAFCLILWEILQ